MRREDKETTLKRLTARDVNQIPWPLGFSLITRYGEIMVGRVKEIHWKIYDTQDQPSADKDEICSVTIVVSDLTQINNGRITHREYSLTFESPYHFVPRDGKKSRSINFVSYGEIVTVSALMTTCI